MVCVGCASDKLKLSSREERKDALPLPSGVLFVSGSHDGFLRAWDERGRCAITLQGHDKAVYAVVNLPDGRVASAGADNTVRIWNLRTAKCETVVRGHSDSIFCLRVLFADPAAAAAQANQLAAASAAAVAGASIPSLAAPPSARVLPSFRIASGSADKTIRVWNSSTYKCEATLTGHTGSVLSMAQISESLLATGSLDKTIRVWNVDRGRCELVMPGHLSSVSGLAVLDDPTRFASCSYDETVKIWHISVNTAAGGSGASSSPASAATPASADGSEQNSFKLEKSVRAHSSAIMNILHIPAHGSSLQRLVTCSRDLNIKVWVLPPLGDGSGAIGPLRCVANLTGHRNDINNLCVLSDQRTLVSCSSDCMIKTYDLAREGNISISELSITNTNPDGKGYTVYAVAPLDSKRTIRKNLAGPAADSSVSGELDGAAAQHVHQQYSAMNPPLSQPRSAAVPHPVPILNKRPQQPTPARPLGAGPGSAIAPTDHVAPSPLKASLPRSGSRTGLDGLKEEHSASQTPEIDSGPGSEPLEPASGSTSVEASDSDIDDDERRAKPLLLKSDPELDASLRAVIQKYRLKHYLNYSNLIEEGFYDDGGVVFVTTSHVPKSAAALAAQAQAQAAKTQQQKQLSSGKPPTANVAVPAGGQKISLNNRLSYASSSSSPSAVPFPSPQFGAQPSPQQGDFRSSGNNSPTLGASASTVLSPSSSLSPSSAAAARPIRPFKQWTEEIIVLDSRWDQNLRSTIDEAKRLLASVSDPRARIMALALFVSNKLGGSPRDIVKSWEQTIAKLSKVYGTTTNGTVAPRLVLPIGSLIGRVGLSRHRALLFKYLCDQTVIFPEAWAPPIPATSDELAAEAARRHTGAASPTASPPASHSASSSVSTAVASSSTHSAPPPPTYEPSQLAAVPIDLYATVNSSHNDTTAVAGPRIHLGGETELGVDTPLHLSPSAPQLARGASSQAVPAVVAEGGSGAETEDAEVARTAGRSRTANHSRSRSVSDAVDPSAGGAPSAAASPTHKSKDSSASHTTSPVRSLVIPSRGTSLGEPHAFAAPAAEHQRVYPSIHCRLMRGQYEYHFPRSRKNRKGRGSLMTPTRTWEESWEDQEAGYSRHQEGGSSKTFHAWAVVELAGQHYVVDLSYEPSQLYPESSKEAAHYNRGRLGDVRKTGLTAAPLRSLHEIAWHELTDLVLLRDGGFGRVERANYRGLEVVVKTPLSLDTYILKTFLEEAGVLNLLSHPNIVKLVGVCTEKKAIVLDFVRGGDLHTFLKTQAALRNGNVAAPAIAAEKPGQNQSALMVSSSSGIGSSSGPSSPSSVPRLTLLERLDLCIQTALGMLYLHWCEPMITHRDLKTLNLLISTVTYNPDELSPTPPPHQHHAQTVTKRVIKGQAEKDKRRVRGRKGRSKRC